MGGGMGYVRVLQVGGEWWNGGTREVLGPPMGLGGTSVGVRGCPLTPHGPRNQFGGSTGVSYDLLSDSWRCWGVPLTPETTRREYWGIPWPHKQTRGIMPAGMYIA